eukprot:COSAG01_NODE_32275_length_583_cov_25.690083_1_plen_150_part_01
MKAGTNRSSCEIIFQHMTTSTEGTNGHDCVFQSTLTGSDTVDSQIIFQHMTTSTGSTSGHDCVFQSTMTGSDSVDPQHECDGYISASDSAMKAGTNRSSCEISLSWTGIKTTAWDVILNNVAGNHNVEVQCIRGGNQLTIGVVQHILQYT